MSILFEAWRRARGEAEEISRALGAPPAARSARSPVLPWVLCIVLAAVAGGLGVYAWRAHRGGRAPAPRAGAVTPAQATPVSSGVGRQGAATAGTGRIAAAGRPVRHAVSGAAPGHAGAGSAATAPVAIHTGPAAPSPGTGGGSRVAGAGASRGTVPDAVRAALPSFKVTVHVWNPSPSARFVVVNGSIYHEGQTIVPGVRLVKITRGGEVVRFRGRRLELSGP